MSGYLDNRVSFAISPSVQPRSFAKLAWWVLAYNLLVVVWGALVRATGSGAGCGAHWPLCNGEVIPEAERLGTKIEFAHRASSGIGALLVVAMAILAFRVFKRGSIVRKAAVASALFMAGEVIVGAGLVLLRLVEQDKSILRAVSMSVHLMNTFFLLAALALTAWWAGREEKERAAFRWRGQGALSWLLLGVMASLVLVGVSGALAALGDTLFPAASHEEGFAEDFSPTAHLFVRLRVLHPVFAVSASALALAAAAFVRRARPSPRVRGLSLMVSSLVIAQVACGVLNLFLLAPVPMQLVHLVVADAVWIAFVLLGAAALSTAAAHAPEPAPVAAAE